MVDMKTFASTAAALLLLSMASCQRLNGHINPLWLSTDRDFGYQQSSVTVPSGLQLYYLDSTGTFRRFSSPSSSSASPTQPPLSIYRSSNPDYNGNRRSGYYNGPETSYMTRNY